MRSRVSRNLVVGSTAALLVAFGTVACGSDEPDQPRGAGSTSDSPPSSEATPGGSESSPTEASASVAPAAGPRTELGGVASYRLPKGPDWVVDESDSRSYASAGIAGGIIDITGEQDTTQRTSVEEVADLVLETLKQYGAFSGYRRGDNRTVHGVEGWVITAKNRQQDYYQFGTMRGDRYLTISFAYPPDYAEAEDVIDSVLASVEWG